ncbi:phage major capsid protein [Mycolicibacterium llatzerense]|uniref:phage major capsid protein n=1 Tax=Mycolicibacterium llatzerense TaxID=280871 RepID=UPI000698030D|nr:phage major capsid protein [Mycolicibacterium llatzerense]MCT7371447.1 hypothetical protein [Mycolicibacterium llatzerense]
MNTINKDNVFKVLANRSEAELREIIRANFPAKTQDSRAIQAAKFWGGDAATGPVETPADGEYKRGAEVNPLKVDAKALKGLHERAVRRESFATKAFSTVDSLLPAQLDPQVLAKIHENRIMDLLPVESISAPSYEVLVHQSTTGSPAPTAEGAAKPEISFNMSSQVFSAIKVACHFGLSHEVLQDFGAFQGYTQNEAMRLMGDVENAQILSGSGTGGNMTGLINTSGVLTHDASTDTGTNVTAIDSIEIAANALRIGSALAEANLLILHPSTFSAIRRLKNTLGNFLIGDPAEVGRRELFGIPVILTTAQTAGTGVMLDTTKFGRVLLREGLSIHVGTSGTDLVSNIARFVLEERFVIAVERPAAVMVVSNLPTTP